MGLTRDLRQTAQGRVRRDPAFREGHISDAIESLLCGVVTLGEEPLRDYINATGGLPTEVCEVCKIA